MKKIKTFDCVEMKDKAQEMIQARTAGMTPEEELAYWAKRTAIMRRRTKDGAGTAQGVVAAAHTLHKPNAKRPFAFGFSISDRVSFALRRLEQRQGNGCRRAVDGHGGAGNARHACPTRHQTIRDFHAGSLPGMRKFRRRDRSDFDPYGAGPDLRLNRKNGVLLVSGPVPVQGIDARFGAGNGQARRRHRRRVVFGGAARIHAERGLLRGRDRRIGLDAAHDAAHRIADRFGRGGFGLRGGFQGGFGGLHARNGVVEIAGCAGKRGDVGGGQAERSHLRGRYIVEVGEPRRELGFAFGQIIVAHGKSPVWIAGTFTVFPAAAFIRPKTAVILRVMDCIRHETAVVFPVTEYLRRVAKYKGRVMEYADRDAKYWGQAGFRRVVRRSIGGFRGHLDTGTPAFRRNAGVFCDEKRAQTRRKQLFAAPAKHSDERNRTQRNDENGRRRGRRGGIEQVERRGGSVLHVQRLII